MIFHEYLLAQGQADLAQILKLPFVKGLGMGGLTQAQRNYYVAQDSYYVDQFIQLADQVTQALPAGFASAPNLGNDESDAHLGLAPSKEWSEIPIGQHNLAYLAHMQQAVAIADPVAGLIALLPCTESYYLIAQTLQAQHNAQGYQQWLNYYCSDAYQATVNWAWTTLDQLVPNYQDLAENQLQIYKDIYQKSYAYETSFWLEAGKIK